MVFQFDLVFADGQTLKTLKSPQKSPVRAQADTQFIVEASPVGTDGAHCYANVFSVVRDPRFTIIYLAANHGVQVVSLVALILSEGAIQTSKDAMLTYYNRLVESGLGKASTPGTLFSISNPVPYYGNLIDASHFGELGQLKLSYFNVRAFTTGSEKERVAKAIDVVSVDMSVETQLAILKELYLK